MNITDKIRKINQPRVILGILRETIFLQTRFEITFETNEVSFAELLTVHEEQRRNENEHRTLFFKLEQDTQHEQGSLNPDRQLQLKFGVSSFLISCMVQIYEVHKKPDGIYVRTSVPDSVDLTNLRKNRRKSSEISIASGSVLVRSGTQHTEGVFSLKDYSRGGYGGILQLPCEFQLSQDAVVQGKIKMGSQILHLNCVVKRALKIDDTRTEFQSYVLGLENTNSETNGSVSIAADLERRQSNRISVAEHVELKPTLNQDFEFKLIVDEASVTGFSGKMANSSESFEFPIGSTFQIASPDLTVKLEGFQNERLRFSISGGTLENRLAWFKRLSPYLLAGVSHSIFDAKDLLEIFCASGALSSEYLQTQRTQKHELLAPLEGTTTNQFWVHRWIHHNDRNDLTGHLCALKAGDSGWVMTDLVGSPNKESKLPKHFVELFFKSFSEFSMNVSPCPIHLYSWLMDHPYWQKFRKDLFEKQLVIEKTFSGYTRYGSTLLSASGPSAVEMLEIKPVEYALIETCRERLRKNGTLTSAAFLDFDFFRFGSPALKNSFRMHQQAFERKYYRASYSGTTWLSVFTDYPTGSSLNRLPEAIWTFNLDEALPGDFDWSSFARDQFTHALKLGIKPTSIRRVFNSPVPQLFKGESAIMENMFIHPSGSALYRSQG